MMHYYVLLLGAAVKRVISRVDWVMNAVLLLAAVIVWVKPELAAHMLGLDGFDRRWAIVPLSADLAWHLASANYEVIEGTRRRLAEVEDSMFLGLAFENLSPEPVTRMDISRVGGVPVTANISLGIRLRNACDRPIEYRVTLCDAVLDGKRRVDAIVHNEGGVIYRDGQTDYMLATIVDIPFTKNVNQRNIIEGYLDFRSEYGPPGRPLFWMHRKLALTFHEGGNHVYPVESSDGKVIDVPTQTAS